MQRQELFDRKCRFDVNKNGSQDLRAVKFVFVTMQSWVIDGFYTNRGVETSHGMSFTSGPVSRSFTVLKFYFVYSFNPGSHWNVKIRLFCISM